MCPEKRLIHSACFVPSAPLTTLDLNHYSSAATTSTTTTVTPQLRMFSSFAAFASQTLDEVTPPKNIPPPTPVTFPRCTPSQARRAIPRQALVSYLQTIHRPTDLSLEHLEALNLHVVHDAPLESLLPDASFLPPREEWTSIAASELSVLNEGTRRTLGNGAKSPGAETFVERLGELSIANDAAFRTVRRVPASPGQPLVRLGNAYEFFKNLELLANYWDDTSITTPSDLEAADSMDVDSDLRTESRNVDPSRAKRHSRTGAGSLMPNDVRQNLLTSFVKLVSYDFGCNVTIPRLEPRLHLNSQGASPMHSYFPSTPIFVYRTPISRQDARTGIVEGPVVALSARAMTDFGKSGASKIPTQPSPCSPTNEEVADLSREIINILTTAQLRSREHQTEVRYGDGKWWTTKPRWGGGVGGPIGREIKEPKQPPNHTTTVETAEEEKKKKQRQQRQQQQPENSGETVIPTTEFITPPTTESTTTTTAQTAPSTSDLSETTNNRITASTNNKNNRANKPERKKQKIKKKGGQMEIYDAYRMVRPPATNWDRKTRYMAIGKSSDTADAYDDVFLISCLFHHVSVVRARVSMALLDALEGKLGDGEDEEVEEGLLEELVIWRSKWFDLFRVEERVEALGLVWGVLGVLLRGREEGQEEGRDDGGGGDGGLGDGAAMDVEV